MKLQIALSLLGLFSLSLPMAAQPPNTPQPAPPSTSPTTGADGNVNWFQRLDTDSDGSLSRDEFARFSALNGTSQSNANINGSTTATTGTGAVGNFKTLDTNGDDRISVEEFAHFPTLNGTSQPGTAPDGTNPDKPRAKP
jgi:hypothetical protein